MSTMDPRIPVVFFAPGAPLPPGSAVLVGDHGTLPDAAVVLRVARQAAGAFACACCRPRGDVAQALGQLFFSRARGEVTFFRQLVVAAELESEVRAALAGDVLAAARYRLADPGA